MIEHVADGLAFTGQEDAHVIRTIAIGQRYNLIKVVFSIKDIRVWLVHHRYSGSTAKSLVLRIGNIERSGPFALKVNRIQQIADRKGVERLFIQHFLDHSLGMIAGPLVDHVHRLSVIEVAVLRLGVIEFVGLLDKTVLQPIAQTFVYEDGIGDKCLGLLVECISLCEHFFTEGVDGIGTRLTEAERAIYFL